MKVDIDNYEVECGFPCTPEGCCGHDTGIPEKITINDRFTLTLDEFNHGDWPFLNTDDEKGEIELWKQTVAEIEARLSKE